MVYLDCKGEILNETDWVRRTLVPRELFEKEGTPGYESMMSVKNLFDAKQYEAACQRVSDIGEGRIRMMDSAFAQNVAMSVMFLTALFQRETTKGFSLLGAVHYIRDITVEWYDCCCLESLQYQT